MTPYLILLSLSAVLSILPSSSLARESTKAIEAYRLQLEASIRQEASISSEVNNLRQRYAAELRALTACTGSIGPTEKLDKCQHHQSQFIKTGNEIQDAEGRLRKAEAEADFVRASAPDEMVEWQSDVEFFRACKRLHPDAQCQDALKERMRTRRR